MNTVYQTIEYNGNTPINIFVTGSLRHSVHFHEDIEVIYVLKGKMKLHIEETFYMLGAKDIVVVNSNEIHSIDDDSTATNAYLVIQLKPSFFEYLNIPIKSTRILCNSRFIHREHSSLQSDYSDVYENLRKEFDVILDLQENPGTFAYIDLISSIFSVLSIILKNFPIVKDDFKARTKEKDDSLIRVSSIIQYLNENYKEDISIDNLAAKYHISVSHLCHIFKKTVGVSIGQYLTNIRLEKTKEMLLLNRDDSVTNIAMDCGFRNLGYFYSVFHKRIGCTPSQFRESNIDKKYYNIDSIQKLHHNGHVTKQKSSGYKVIKKSKFIIPETTSALT